MEPFILRAATGALACALVAASLGCLIQWRRMSFFGDALAHTVLLGIGLSLLLDVHHFAGVSAVLILFVLFVHAMHRRGLSTDTVIAAGAHIFLAAGVAAIYMSGSVVRWETLLFGSILAVDNQELAVVLGAAVFVAFALGLIWKNMVTITVNREIAAAEIRGTRRIELAFLLLLAIYTAFAAHIVGILLVNALIVIPPSIARPLSNSPANMLVLACLFATASVLAGMLGSLAFDMPASPAIILAGGMLFACVWSCHACAAIYRNKRG